MGTYAVIDSGVVTNIVVAENNHAVANGWIDIDNIIPPPTIGSTFINGVWTSPPASAPTPIQAAAAQLQQMADIDLPAFTTQLQADIATVTSTGWASLTAQQQHDIMLRILNGFGSVMTAIQAHAVATGTLP